MLFEAIFSSFRLSEKSLVFQLVWGNTSKDILWNFQMSEGISWLFKDTPNPPNLPEETPWLSFSLSEDNSWYNIKFHWQSVRITCLVKLYGYLALLRRSPGPGLGIIHSFHLVCGNTMTLYLIWRKNLAFYLVREGSLALQLDWENPLTLQFVWGGKYSVHPRRYPSPMTSLRYSMAF